MLVKDYKPKVGDWVRTNGDCGDTTDFFEGEIGEIDDTDIFVWHNVSAKSGRKGSVKPKGYNFSWGIYKDNGNAEIEILKRDGKSYSDKPCHQFKVGDKVRIKNNSWGGCFNIGTHCKIVGFNSDNDPKLDSLENGGYHQTYKESDLELVGEAKGYSDWLAMPIATPADVLEGLNKLIKPNKLTKTMSNIVTFAKNLALSKEEKLLRKYGLKDECGNYTAYAGEIIMKKLIEDNEAELIKICEAKEAEEKK
jgi:hypothetical protein